MQQASCISAYHKLGFSLARQLQPTGGQQMKTWGSETWAPLGLDLLHICLKLNKMYKSSQHFWHMKFLMRTEERVTVLSKGWSTSQHVFIFVYAGSMGQSLQSIIYKFKELDRFVFLGVLGSIVHNQDRLGINIFLNHLT